MVNIMTTLEMVSMITMNFLMASIAFASICFGIKLVEE
jgi:hypothetical protein